VEKVASDIKNIVKDVLGVLKRKAPNSKK